MTGLARYFGLTGKTVLVTGSTSGIGLAMVEAFAEAGARIVVSSHEEDECLSVASRLCAAGAQAVGIRCDVRKAGDLKALAAKAESALGPIDVLVCNAGVSLHHGSMADADEATLNETLAMNLRHPLTLTGLVAPGMAKRGQGSIILTASLAGLRGNKAIGLYGLTKAALIQLARNLAVEYGPAGVRANAIAPGLIETGWTKAILSSREASERRLGLTPLRRLGQPWEVAAAALYLAGPGGGFTTGQTLVVDGGSLITDGN